MDDFGLLPTNYNAKWLLLTELYAFLNFFHLRDFMPKKTTGASKLVLFGRLLMIVLKGCLCLENQGFCYLTLSCIRLD